LVVGSLQNYQPPTTNHLLNKMADKQKAKQVRLQRRKWSTRSTLFGTTDRPRLSVFRSDKHIYAQVIDDYSGNTLVSVASTSAEVRGELANGGNIEAAKRVGKQIAERAKAKGITKVAFDRGGRKYHGRVKALADAAREGGLSF
jgi:large subunit ribosomal protein L18